MSRLIKKLLSEKRGATLVEMIISFALLAMFVASAGVLVTNITNLYYRISNMEKGMQVVELVMDKVTGELWGAQAGVPDTASGQTKTMLVTGNKIDFYDKNGNHVYLTSKDGGLLLHYYEASDLVGNGLVTGTVLYNAVDWTYDKDAYMGFSVSELSFSVPGGNYAGNVVKVQVTVTNDRNPTMSFTSERYVECFNFKEEDYGKIG